MTRLFTKKAPKAPGRLAFHIHQVVSTLQPTIWSHVSHNNFFQLVACVLSQSCGIQATKMSRVSGDTGHAAHSSNDPDKATSTGGIRFTQEFICVKITKRG